MEGKKEMKAIKYSISGVIVGSGLCLLYNMFISYNSPIVPAGFFVGGLVVNKIIEVITDGKL